MWVTGFFLRNGRFSLVAFFFLLALGIRSYLTIPVSEDPSLEIPRFDVVVIVPGGGPFDLEQSVAKPLEESLKELDSLKRITTKLHDGVCHLSVEFLFGTDPDRKYDEVVRQVNAQRPRMPAGVMRLEVLRGQTSNVAIMQLALMMPGANEAELQNTAEQLRRQIGDAKGVKRAETHAISEGEVRATLNLSALAAQHVTLPRLIATLQGSQSEVPGGSVEINDRRVNITTGGAISDLDDLRNLPIPSETPGTIPTKVSDVAELSWSYDPHAVQGRFDGRRAVFLTVMMQVGGNIDAVSEAVRTVIRDFEKHLPPGARIEIGFDQSQNVKRRMRQLEQDFGLALLLVLLTLAPLGTRPALIVMISIPLCLALGLGALQWFGFGLNQLSIVGCVIALGLLVDDSIVVIENIARFRRDGHSSLEAALLGTRQIMVAVIGTTATLVLAFLPLLMLPEAAGLFVRSLPAAVVFSVTASLVVALTIVPWLAGFLMRGAHDGDANMLLRLFQRLIASLYSPVLRWCMRHRISTLVLMTLVCGASALLLPAIGFSLFPKADVPMFLVEITTPEGSSRANTEHITRRVEELIRSQPEVKHYFTTLGEGNPRVYYNVFPTDRRANVAAILVMLRNYDNEATPALIEKLRGKAEHFGNAHIEFREFQNGPPLTAPIEVRILGDDLAKSAQAAAAIEAALRDTPGVDNIDNTSSRQRLDVKVSLDETKLASLGVGRSEAQHLVRLVFSGLEAGKIHDEQGVERVVRLCLPTAAHDEMEDWGETPVPAGATGLVPLKEVASFAPLHSPALLERRNGERLLTVSARVRKGFNVGHVTDDLRQRLSALPLAPSCRWEFGGEWESRQESFGGLGNAILIAVFGILAVLVLEFRTFRGTLIVASVIPLGIVGGLLGLWIAGYSLSFMAAIGFVALIGIEIKNSILLVDLTNQMRLSGVALDEAIARAGEIRFLPVALTTLTALGALLPLALQRSALFSPLATVIMGGSLSSLLLSRPVTPVLYRILPPRVQTSGRHH